MFLVFVVVVKSLILVVFKVFQAVVVGCTEETIVFINSVVVPNAFVVNSVVSLCEFIVDTEFRNVIIVVRFHVLIELINLSVAVVVVASFIVVEMVVWSCLLAVVGANVVKGIVYCLVVFSDILVVSNSVVVFVEFNVDVAIIVVVCKAVVSPAPAVVPVVSLWLVVVCSELV